MCVDYSDRRSLPMTKWEYQFLIAEKYGKGIFGFVLPKEISWKIHYINGKQQQNWGDVTLFNYLVKMGEQGWEVAAMTSHMSVRSGTLPVEHLYIVLKKPQES
jgi:hypothetical protein